MSFWVIMPSLAAITCVLTWVLLRYALARSLMDVPNARSSHRVPTPRGGGLAIAVTFTVAMPLFALAGWADWRATSGLLLAGGLMAVIGFVDDHRSVQARWRLLIHFVAVGWLLFCLPGLPELVVLGVSLDLGWVGYCLLALMLVWLLNLYNFMDGIDGLAAVEAITVCLGGTLLLILTNHIDLILAPTAVAAMVAGFLVWNFPPARIFMGDAGSGFIGIILGGLMLQAAWAEPRLLWAWLILLGVFIVDATYTLLRRLLRGERVYEAHRSHAYQAAALHKGSHLPVTIGVMVINVGWLWPWAIVVALEYLDGLIALLIAWAPLLYLTVYYRAGAPEEKGPAEQ